MKKVWWYNVTSFGLHIKEVGVQSPLQHEFTKQSWRNYSNFPGYFVNFFLYKSEVIRLGGLNFRILDSMN